MQYQGSYADLTTEPAPYQFGNRRSLPVILTCDRIIGEHSGLALPQAKLDTIDSRTSSAEPSTLWIIPILAARSNGPILLCFRVETLWRCIALKSCGEVAHMTSTEQFNTRQVRRRLIQRPRSPALFSPRFHAGDTRPVSPPWRSRRNEWRPDRGL